VYECGCMRQWVYERGVMSDECGYMRRCDECGCISACTAGAPLT
jgi:hypothetical protein